MGIISDYLFLFLSFKNLIYVLFYKFKTMIKFLENLQKQLLGKVDFDASQAYSLTKFGRVLTKEKLLQEIKNSIEEDIKLKIRYGKYSLSVDIDETNKEFVNELKKIYIEKGFSVYIVDDSIFSDLKKDGLLLISWRK